MSGPIRIVSPTFLETKVTPFPVIVPLTPGNPRLARSDPVHLTVHRGRFRIPIQQPPSSILKKKRANSPSRSPLFPRPPNNSYFFEVTFESFLGAGSVLAVESLLVLDASAGFDASSDFPEDFDLPA